MAGGGEKESQYDAFDTKFLRTFADKDIESSKQFPYPIAPAISSVAIIERQAYDKSHYSFAVRATEILHLFFSARSAVPQNEVVITSFDHRRGGIIHATHRRRRA